MIVPLEEDNWCSWKVNMRTVLMRRRLWARRLRGGHARLGSPPGETQEWLQADGEAYREIFLHASDLYKHLLANTETSADAWTKLCAHFENAGLSARLDLK